MKTRTQTRSNYSARSWIAAALLALSVAAGGAGCKNPDAILIRATADEAVEQIEIFVRDDATGEVVFKSGWNPTTRAGETARDISKKALKVALKLSEKGAFTLLIVGVIGQTDGELPAVGSKQFFWAGRVKVTGTEEVRAHLYGVPTGQDADRDLWPSGATWLTANPSAAAEFATKMDLLDCYDATADMPKPTTTGKTVDAAKINPFATEICGDGVDEACNGDTDEKCVDKDGDGDPSGSDCDDNNPARHNATAADPYPDPANCCGYSLGFLKGTPEGNKSYVGDPMLCPTVRCGDGIDNSCKGIENVAANDTKCLIDADCDGFSPPADCDDNDPNTYPGAPEPCGGTKDLNCSGKANDGCLPCDLDGDGFQRNDSTNGCPNADDKNPGKFDCNDYDSSVFPGASTAVLPTRTIGLGGTEAGGTAEQHIESARRGYCRRYYETTTVIGTPRVAAFSQTAGDFDCDGNAYNGCPSVACDADGDGFPNSGAGCAISGIPVDCNDNDPTIFPGAPDKCGDSILQDCFQDKPCAGDTDGDGYVGMDDCAEGDPNRHPFATELCNGLDDDCDGLVDEGNPDGTGKPLVEADKVMSCTDSDVGECGKKKGACVCSAASANSTKDPGGMMDACPTELTATGNSKDKCFGAGQPQKQSCNPLDPKDDDCDGRVDAPDGKNLAILNQACGTDVGECTVGQIIGCDMSKTNCFASLPTPENAWIVCSTDAICPKAELCNGKDDNCDGALPTDEQDLDGDKYLACGTAGCDMSGLASGLMGCGDCADSLPVGGVAASAIHPTAPDACDGVDNNCAGDADEGETCPAGSNGAPGGHAACCPNPGGYKCRDLRAATELSNCTSCGTVCDLAKSDRCSATGCVCGTTGAQCSNNDQCTTVSTDTRCRRPQGSTCSVGNDCLSGNCADNVCCDTACTGQCEHCNGTGGVCTQTSGAPVTGMGTTRAACSGTAGDRCDGTCSNNRNACTYPATPTGTGTTCPGASCLNGSTQLNAVTTCNGAGDCSAQTQTSCAANTCSCTGTGINRQCTQTVNSCTGTACAAVNTGCGDLNCNGTNTACLTGCTGDSDCAKSNKPYCNTLTGACSAYKQPGRACSGNGECDAGVGPCLGTCCITACSPTSCMTNQQLNYQCAAVTGICTPGSPVSCGSYTCNGNVSCFGAGSCGCSNAPCNDSTHCAGGNYCSASSGGNCAPKKNNGDTCSPPTDGDQCTSGICDTNKCCNVSCGPCGACGTGTCTAIGDFGTPESTCGSYLCRNGSFDCPAAGTCRTDADCVTGAYCDGSNNCVTKKNPGDQCSGPASTECGATASTCAGPALDGNYYCCQTACAANIMCKADLTDVNTSQTCVTTGVCHSLTVVASAPGDCSAGQYCSAASPSGCTTDKTAGTACTQNAECATSDTCRTNCCTSSAACNGACATGQCSGTGACAAKSQGAAPSSTCGDFLCNGTLTTCPTTCTSDAECADSGKYCDATGACTAQLGNNADCTPLCFGGGTACRICAAGRTCKDTGMGLKCQN